MRIIQSQMPVEEKKGYCDMLIDNSGSLEETRRQVVDLWQKLTEILKARSEQKK
jgi:dephospho-CoA kinase